MTNTENLPAYVQRYYATAPKSNILLDDAIARDNRLTEDESYVKWELLLDDYLFGLFRLEDASF